MGDGPARAFPRNREGFVPSPEASGINEDPSQLLDSELNDWVRRNLFDPGRRVTAGLRSSAAGSARLPLLVFQCTEPLPSPGGRLHRLSAVARSCRREGLPTAEWRPLPLTRTPPVAASGHPRAPRGQEVVPAYLGPRQERLAPPNPPLGLGPRPRPPSPRQPARGSPPQARGSRGPGRPRSRRRSPGMRLHSYSRRRRRCCSWRKRTSPRRSSHSRWMRSSPLLRHLEVSLKLSSSSYPECRHPAGADEQDRIAGLYIQETHPQGQAVISEELLSSQQVNSRSPSICSALMRYTFNRPQAREPFLPAFLQKRELLQ